MPLTDAERERLRQHIEAIDAYERLEAAERKRLTAPFANRLNALRTLAESDAGPTNHPTIRRSRGNTHEETVEACGICDRIDAGVAAFARAHRPNLHPWDTPANLAGWIDSKRAVREVVGRLLPDAERAADDRAAWPDLFDAALHRVAAFAGLAPSAGADVSGWAGLSDAARGLTAIRAWCAAATAHGSTESNAFAPAPVLPGHFVRLSLGAEAIRSSGESDATYAAAAVAHAAFEAAWPSPYSLADQPEREAARRAFNDEHGHVYPLTVDNVDTRQKCHDWACYQLDVLDRVRQDAPGTPFDWSGHRSPANLWLVRDACAILRRPGVQIEPSGPSPTGPLTVPEAMAYLDGIRAAAASGLAADRSNAGQMIATASPRASNSKTSPIHTTTPQFRPFHVPIRAYTSDGMRPDIAAAFGAMRTALYTAMDLCRDGSDVALDQQPRDFSTPVDDFWRRADDLRPLVTAAVVAFRPVHADLDRAYQRRLDLLPPIPGLVNGCAHLVTLELVEQINGCLATQLLNIRSRRPPGDDWQAELANHRLPTDAWRLVQPQLAGYAHINCERLLQAMWREAVNAVATGRADAPPVSDAESPPAQSVPPAAVVPSAVVAVATGQPRLNDTEQFAVDALREAGHRMTGEPLSNKAWGKYDGHAKGILAALVTRGVLTNRADLDPRGYGLPEWG